MKLLKKEGYDDVVSWFACGGCSAVDDNVIDTVEDYEKGIITAEQALGLLRYKEVNHQICILNQKVIDRYLVFVESVTYLNIMSKNNITPFVATHPGEMIKDELKERNMTQKQLSEMSGIKASILSETINGKRSISLNMAVALEKVLGIPADIWMNMQNQYDLDSANIAERNTQSQTVTITIPARDRNLLKEVARKFGWACML